MVLSVVKLAVHGFCINGDHIFVYIAVLKLYSEMLFLVFGNVNMFPDITINYNLYIFA